MMRQTVIYLIAATICVIVASMSPVSGTSAEMTSLENLVTENANLNLDAKEMAFLLATHGYDATPKGDSIIVKMDGEICKIVP
jgi:hypothetical protein